MVLVFVLFLYVFGVEVINAIPLTTHNQTELGQPRIIGGVDAPESYSPYMVALVVGERPRLMCGGSIISRSLVLTAAHCVDDLVANRRMISSLRIRAGSNKWNSGGVLVQVTDIHIHPQWNSQLIKYDAAILVLAEKLVLSDRIAEVQLGSHHVGGQEKSLVTGWGRTGPRIENDVINLFPTPVYLQLLYLNTISHEECQRQINKVAEFYGIYVPHIQKDVEICTFHSRGVGMCMGDSGSALIQVSTGCQIGIVSWGLNCADGAPDIFVRVEGVRPFLDIFLAVYK